MFDTQEIEAPELVSLMENEADGFHLLDVRSPEEMSRGMLPNAQAAPMHLLPLRLDEWQNARKIVVYCHSGARSGQVCAFLKQQGIGQAVNLRGGIFDWYRRGLPIEIPQQAR
jgi:rhodanese-related sulfurtransferase